MSSKLRYRQLTGDIINAFYCVYNELGHGFLESVYENALLYELVKRDFQVKQQYSIPVYYQEQLVGDFKADLLIDDKVILELKTAKTLAPEHMAQLLNYLKATKLEVGLLLNFGPKPQFKRLILT